MNKVGDTLSLLRTLIWFLMRFTLVVARPICAYSQAKQSFGSREGRIFALGLDKKPGGANYSANLRKREYEPLLLQYAVGFGMSGKRPLNSRTR